MRFYQMVRYLFQIAISNVFFKSTFRAKMKTHKKQKDIVSINGKQTPHQEIIKICQKLRDNSSIKIFFLNDIPNHPELLDAFIEVVKNNSSIIHYRYHTVNKLSAQEIKKLEDAFKNNLTFEKVYLDKKFYVHQTFANFGYRNTIISQVSQIMHAVKNQDYGQFEELLKLHRKSIQTHVEQQLEIYSPQFNKELHQCDEWSKMTLIHQQNFKKRICEPYLEKKAKPSRLSRNQLLTLCLAYKTESWLGCFLQIISWGFYQHQSATMAGLNKLVNDRSKDSFSKEDIIESIASSNNQDRQKLHRLSFFQSPGAHIESGTDKVILSIVQAFS